MIIGHAVLADLDAIEDIERHSFPRPWPRAQFEAELVREHAHIIVVRDDSATAVAGRQQPIIAFANFWIVAGEVHVHSIAVHPDRRRGGIAARVLEHLLDAGRVAGATLATLEVRRGNVPAIALYERAGFETVTVRAGYYQDNLEDALVMTARLA